MKRLWKTAGFAMALGAGAAAAQTDFTALYEGDRFAVSVEEITEGVYVMIREPSWRMWVQANTTLIVNQEDAVLIDGGFGVHAENVIEAIRQITDKPVSVIITTHWHHDHTVGRHVFKDAWPDARIISHENTRPRVAEELAGSVPEYAERTDEELLASTRERMAEQDARRAPESVLAFYRDALEGLPAVREDFARWRPELADETFSDRLTLHRGDRDIEIFHFGAANTRGDAIIWLPEERIVFTGDTVVRPTPYGFGSRPANWAQVLREINALDYETLVPGHGDIQRDDVYVSLLARTMEQIAAAACAAVEEGTEGKEEIHQAIDWNAIEPQFTGGDPLFAHLFDIWFKQPISEGALAEIEDGETDCRPES